MTNKTVVVGLSGGVDSAVSAFLLREQGWRVIGIFMKNWEDDESEYCSSRQDFLDAAAVADRLDIELQAVNFAAEYRERVFSEFLRELKAGRTPNPDVLCNAEIKFKAFLDHALAQGADWIATGHYARLRRTESGEVQLLRGLDPSKDQSYFLHRLQQHQINRVLFPVGELHKTEVRAIAQRIGLPNAAKKDSTGICFIGERPFRAFLSEHLRGEPGPIETPDGIRIGRHVGLPHYTLGQSKGLGIGGVRVPGLTSEEGKGWYVVQKHLRRNTLVVAQVHDHPLLMSRSLRAGQVVWTSGQPPHEGVRLGAKTRYRQPDAAARVVGASESGLDLEFDEPQWAVTPGQSAVLYDGEVCLGGGIIEEAESTETKDAPTVC